MLVENSQLHLEGISKSFPGIRALDAVDLTLNSGEVHALIGENGAGKSTLVKIVSGLYQPDEGEMTLGGETYQPSQPKTAIDAGVRVIYQELSLVGTLTVAENIFFDNLPKKRGLLNTRMINRNAEQLLETVGLNIAPGTRVDRLGIAQQQQVEIAKALTGESRLIIMDEPTASLTEKESRSLFEVVRRLRVLGKTVLYISHRLAEIFNIADRVTVLRNGRKIQTSDLEGLSVPDLVRMMVGRELGKGIPFREDIIPDPGNILLKVEDFRRVHHRKPVSFSLRAGEILGISGLVGSGRTEMVRSLLGLDPRLSGRFEMNGRPVSLRNPKESVECGIGLLTEDRKDEGLLMPHSCGMNLTLTDIRRISRKGIIHPAKEAEFSEALISSLKIKVQSYRQSAGTLSGGNQQKVVIGKWLYRNCEVLIFDEPTRGIDVGAKVEIYNLLWKLAEEGKGLIVISSEIEEIVGLCHRILVFSDNEITGEFDRENFDQERILAASYSNYI